MRSLEKTDLLVGVLDESLQQSDLPDFFFVGRGLGL